MVSFVSAVPFPLSRLSFVSVDVDSPHLRVTPLSLASVCNVASGPTPLRLAMSSLRGSRAAAVRTRSPFRAVAAVVNPSAIVAGGNGPLSGVSLLSLEGVPQTIPFWAEDQTVVVTMLRHFG